MSIYPIKLAVLDDHPIIHYSFKIMFESEKDIEVIGSFNHSNELFDWLLNNKCDVLVLDYILPDDKLDGLSLVKILLTQYPGLTILLSSSMDSIAVIRTALMMGVKGYISKRDGPAEYVDAIRLLAHGQRYIPRHVSATLINPPKRKRGNIVVRDLPNWQVTKLLTPSEVEVIYYFLTGMSINDIAERLNRNRKTVSGQKQTAKKKLGANSDFELIKYRDVLFNQYNEAMVNQQDFSSMSMDVKNNDTL